MNIPSAKNRRMFDLFEQPFRALRVDPWTPIQEINGSVDQGEPNSSASMHAKLARDILFDSAQRLSYELTFPLDCPRSEIETFYAATALNAPTGQLLQFADWLWPLARSNFLAHIASHRP